MVTYSNENKYICEANSLYVKYVDLCATINPSTIKDLEDQII